MFKRLNQWLCRHDQVKLIGRIETDMTEFSDSTGINLPIMVDTVKCLSCGKEITMEWTDFNPE